MPAAKRPTTAASPTPDATASQAQILVYDGDCRFCTRRANWFRHRLGRRSQPQAQPQALPYQDLPLGELGLAPETVSRQAVWIDADQQRFYGHQAIAKSLIHLGGAWGLLGRLMLLPPFSWLARGIYAIVARNRHRF